MIAMSGWLTSTVFALDDVVDDVAVHRRVGGGRAALQLPQELQQPSGVIALRESLAVHQIPLVEHLVRKQESVGGHEIDLRMVGPARQQRLQDAGERALANRHTAGDADDVRNLRRRRAEELAGGLVQVLRR